jgi:hypothetical protein
LPLFQKAKQYYQNDIFSTKVHNTTEGKINFVFHGGFATFTSLFASCIHMPERAAGQLLTGL